MQTLPWERIMQTSPWLDRKSIKDVELYHIPPPLVGSKRKVYTHNKLTIWSPKVKEIYLVVVGHRSGTDAWKSHAIYSFRIAGGRGAMIPDSRGGFQSPWQAYHHVKSQNLKDAQCSDPQERVVLQCLQHSQIQPTGQSTIQLLIWSAYLFHH